ncbi:flagellar filament capping protein FliD [Chengkuizengella axinellae]|uniref:Flagellar hook-associated protein 2 n=1 Tax=Chengkuizengella axinellae TaxID=3064388 RepID=A0ABT9J2Q1_9BACL|nr:flagellar filament capping protein FliD [Chengkuizengella sp. 2205SS18-9]MDP5275889.1 flagellar filament capping protein FliD [Chengkuizengella sp. 2205SS18-9]
MSTIRFSGLASGLDTESIVKELMNVERLSVTQKEQDYQKVDWKRQEYLDLNSKILEYRNNKLYSFTLEGPLSFKSIQLKGDTNGVSATANSSAVSGSSLQIGVLSLATPASNYSNGKIGSENFDSSASLLNQQLLGNLDSESDSLEPETYKFRINDSEVIEVNTDVDSLDDVINEINENTDVTAFYDENTGQVSFISKQTGLTNGDGKSANIQFEDVDSEENLKFLEDILNVTTDGPNKEDAQNAQVTINGMTTERESNNFEVNGINITLQETGTTTTIEVKTDTDQMVEKIQQFVDDYNEILNLLQEKVGEDKYRDYDPLTDEEKESLTDDEIELWEEKAKSGLLKNDDYLSQAISEMRTAISSVVDTGNSTFSTLSSIGITTGSYEELGKLYLDEDKLREAIEGNESLGIEGDPDAVISLFALNGSEDNLEGAGIAEQIYNTIGNTLNQITEVAGSGTSTTFDESILGKELKRIDDDILDWEDRLIDIEDRYYSQFTAMEQAIEMYNSQLEYILSAFGGQ